MEPEVVEAEKVVCMSGFRVSTMYFPSLEMVTISHPIQHSASQALSWNGIGGRSTSNPDLEAVALTSNHRPRGDARVPEYRRSISNA